MTEEEVRKVVTFVRSRQPRWKRESLDDDFDISLYDRRSELLKGSQEYDIKMDDVYIREFMNEQNTPSQKQI